MANVVVRDPDLLSLLSALKTGDLGVTAAENRASGRVEMDSARKARSEAKREARAKRSAEKREAKRSVKRALSGRNKGGRPRGKGAAPPDPLLVALRRWGVLCKIDDGTITPEQRIERDKLTVKITEARPSSPLLEDPDERLVRLGTNADGSPREGYRMQRDCSLSQTAREGYKRFLMRGKAHDTRAPYLPVDHRPEVTRCGAFTPPPALAPAPSMPRCGGEVSRAAGQLTEQKTWGGMPVYFPTLWEQVVESKSVKGGRKIIFALVHSKAMEPETALGLLTLPRSPQSVGPATRRGIGPTDDTRVPALPVLDSAPRGIVYAPLVGRVYVDAPITPRGPCSPPLNAPPPVKPARRPGGRTARDGDSFARAIAQLVG